MMKKMKLCFICVSNIYKMEITEKVKVKINIYCKKVHMNTVETKNYKMICATQMLHMIFSCNF